MHGLQRLNAESSVPACAESQMELTVRLRSPAVCADWGLLQLILSGHLDCFLHRERELVQRSTVNQSDCQHSNQHDLGRVEASLENPLQK